MDDDFEAEFQEGDIVRLISGGPPMCVRATSRGGGVHVTWFFRGKTGDETYRAKMLVRCEGDEAVALGLPLKLKRGPKPASPAKA